MLTAITNQHIWVAGCYEYYRRMMYEPGNPEDGEWHAAHWPVPGCKGGTQTILLLKEHHAVHGVLQSEEWQHPCIFGWEIAFLTGEILDLFQKWRTELSGLAGTRARELSTPEERSERARKREAAKTPEERSQAAKKRAATLSREEQLRRARLMTEAGSRLTPEQRSEVKRKAWASRDRTAQAEVMRRVNEQRRKTQGG